MENFLWIYLSDDEKCEAIWRSYNIFQYSRENIDFDPDIGFVNKPDLRVVFNNIDFQTNISINSRGFRDDNNSLVNSDVLILGDSFGFGWGVNKNETCESFMEKIGNLKVLNMSVSGYSTVQEFLLLKKFANRNNIKGKIVIFLFFENDLDNNLQGYHFLPFPYLYVEDSLIKFSKPTIGQFNNWLNIVNGRMNKGIARHFFIGDIIYQSVNKIKKRVESKKDYSKTEGDNQRIIDKYETFDLLMKEIKVFENRKKFHTLFIYVPSVDYYLGADKEELVYKINEICERFSVPFIDLSRCLEINDYYYECDGHWKPSGHYKAASEIISYIETVYFVSGSVNIVNQVK
ncbi:MAG: SGNH/GDSL hydrolase family protein [Cytophagales bacterium]|nr:SGNH/GDSL hydrolase family protein [Cytophagales bacterium]